MINDYFISNMSAKTTIAIMIMIIAKMTNY